MHTRVFLTIVAAVVYPSTSLAQVRCGPPIASFGGFWGGGLVQVSNRVGSVPVLVTTRFSYKEIRESPCDGGIAILPSGIGEASVSMGIPILNRRRGGFLLQMAAKGQGSQKPGAPISGVITGAPTTAGHINIWETAIPLIQLTGAASATIVPQARDFPMSIAYLGGIRLYPLYGRHAQANLGMTVGGSNAAINFIPALALRASDLSAWNHRIAIGLEFRSPISLLPGPSPVSWRFWGAFTIAIDEIDDAKGVQSSTAGTSPIAPTAPHHFDLVRSPPEAAPPTQTVWETTL